MVTQNMDVLDNMTFCHVKNGTGFKLLDEEHDYLNASGSAEIG